MVDRRRADPFAPRPRTRETPPPPAPPPPSPPAAPVAAPGAEQGPDLESLRKPELIHLAEQRGLNTGGTKADLIARLRATEQE